MHPSRRRRAPRRASIAVALAAWPSAAPAQSPGAWPQSVALRVVTALGDPAAGAVVEAWDDAQAAGTSTGVVALMPRHDAADEIEVRLLAEPMDGGLEAGVFDPPGASLARATLSLSRQGASNDVGWRHGAAPIAALVDADGIARVAALPSGLWWAQDAERAWFGRALVAVLPGHVARVDLRAD